MTKVSEDSRGAGGEGGIPLRGYWDSDLDAMYMLDVQCFARPFRFSRAAMRRFAEAKNARVVVAEDGDALAGFGILHVERPESGRVGYGGWVGYIVTLDVNPGHRRNGLGRRLMEAMEGQAQLAGCNALMLHVFVGNEAAIRFYERCGFARENLAEGFYRAGVNAWVYSKGMESTVSLERTEQD